MTTPPVILLAHGSRDPRAAVEVRDLATAVRSARPGLRTEVAHLDLSEPDLTTVVVRITQDRAVVVPLLFTSAYHAEVDAPQAISSAARQTGVELVTAGILGTGTSVLRALRNRAAAAGATDRTEILLLAVGSSDPSANAAVAGLAARWNATRPGAVRAGFATVAPKATDVLSAARPGSDLLVVPLFVAPGLLLTAVGNRARERVLAVAEHLGVALTDLVLHRYDRALGRSLGAAAA